MEDFPEMTELGPVSQLMQPKLPHQRIMMEVLGMQLLPIRSIFTDIGLFHVPFGILRSNLDMFLSTKDRPRSVF